MEGIIERLKNDRNRASTKTNYYSVWQSFNEFFIKLDRKPDSWEERLNLFVAYLVETKKKSTTIRSYISAIKAVLQEDGEQISENRFLLNSLTRACRLKNDRVRTRLPIKRSLLNLIISNVDNIFNSPQPYLTCLYKALFMTAYYGLFRVGELTSSPHVLKAKDVHIGRNKKKLMFLLHSSKTHGNDKKTQVIKIHGSEYDVTGVKRLGNIKKGRHCPFHLLKNYVDMRKKHAADNEQFFVFRNREVVTAENFRTTLRKVINYIGLQLSLYRTHSLRAGHAVQMVENDGISVETARKLGRWKSNAIYTYLSNWIDKLKIFIIYHAGVIPARSDVWFIGDDFVNGVFHTLQHLKDKAITDRRDPPYIYQFYNVACYTPNPKSPLRNVLARLVNCFVKALNNAKRLPRLVIIIPESDLTDYLSKNKNFDMKILATKSINWIMNQMNRALQAKEENLKSRCPGSVISTEPKFIWIKKFECISDYSTLLSLRYKYNEALQEQISKRSKHYIMDVNEAMAEKTFFDLTNKLNGRGKVHFWKEVDTQIKLFDQRKITLKPELQAHQIEELKKQAKASEKKKNIQ